MRIIAGRFRSRQLKTVAGNTVRPTPDRLRESLFSILAPRIGGTVFLDAYAGSGAVGIEALSRGAKRVILIERNTAAIETIRQNLDALKIGDEVTLVRGRVTALLRNVPADIVFLDPPYEQIAEYGDALQVLAEMRCALALAQHPSRLELAERYGALEKTRVLKQGDNSISFFTLRDAKDDQPTSIT